MNKLSKRRKWPWLLLLSMIAFLTFCYVYDQRTQRPDTTTPVSVPSSTSKSQNQKTPEKTVLASGALKVTRASVGNCTVLRPETWSLPSVGEGSKSLDLTNPDKSMYAGYGIQAVNTSVAAFAKAYPPPLNDPNLYSSKPELVAKAYAKIIIATLGGDSHLSYTSMNTTAGDYALRSLASSTHQGVVFYHRTGFPGDGYNYAYALPLYFAFTPSSRWAEDGPFVTRLAASIQCHATFVPRASAGPESNLPKDKPADAEEKDAGYNSQLGTEYVHNAETGENYLVSPSENWSENGPNGAGYYVPKGNDYVQLQAGRSD